MSAPDARVVFGRILETKLTKSINFFFQDDGALQVSIQRGNAMSFYGHTGDPGDNPFDVFLKALANGHGGDLDRALGLGAYAEEEDDFSDVI